MYRIRLGSGEETELENVEDLLYGIGSGVIGPDAMIFHARAEQWLPITVHPDYKRATEILGGSPAAQSAPTKPQSAIEPVTRPTRKRGSKRSRKRKRSSLPKAIQSLPLLDIPPEDSLVDSTFDPNLETSGLEAQPSSIAPLASARAPAVDPPDVLAKPSPSPAEPPVPDEPAASLGAWRLEPTAMGDFSAPADEVGETAGEDARAHGDKDQWLPDLAYPEMVSDAVPRRRGIVRARPSRRSWGRLVAALAIVGVLVLGWLGFQRLGGGPGADMPDAAAEPGLSEQQAGAAVSLDAQGEGAEAMPAVALENMAPNGTAKPGDPAVAAATPAGDYSGAYAAARSQFDSVMAGLDFTQMLSQRRLGTESELLNGMGTIRATMNAVHLYRSREMAIEAAHAGGEQSLREDPQAARAVDSVLTSLDTVYGLLLSQYGRYRFAKGVILFSNSAAEDEYDDAQRRVTRHTRALLRYSRDEPSLTVRHIAGGVSDSRLPQLGTVVSAPRVPKVPKLDVEVTGPQWDSIEAERRARATDSILQAGMEVPWQTEEQPLP